MHLGILDCRFSLLAKYLVGDISENMLDLLQTGNEHSRFSHRISHILLLAHGLFTAASSIASSHTLVTENRDHPRNLQADGSVLRRLNAVPDRYMLRANNSDRIKNGSDFSELTGRDDFSLGTLRLDSLEVRA